MKSRLAPSPRMVVEAAERRGIPWSYDPELRLIQFGYGKHRRWIRSMTTSLESEVAVELVQNKHLTKRVLAAADVPVPKGTVVKSARAAVDAFLAIGAPVVLKPVDGHKGVGVSVGLSTPEQVLSAFDVAARFSVSVLVEEQFMGRDFRVLVVDGRVFAAAERKPAHVVGDGFHSLAELIEIENRNPLRGKGREQPMARIEMDEIALALLRKSGTSLNSVPPEGATVYLRENANLSTGGSAFDVTDDLHPEIRSLCERAARVVGLPLCGIDLIVPDISKPFSSQKGGVIEVNAGPGIRVHHFPTGGRARDAGAAILNYLFPEGQDGRIPIVATVSNPGCSFTLSVDRVMRSEGYHVGTVTQGGTWVMGEAIERSGTSYCSSARLVLSDPAVDLAVLEIPDQSHDANELVFDLCDLAIVTRFTEAATTIVERLRCGGILILNAADERLLEMAASRQTRRDFQVVLFATSEHSFLAQHQRNGGKVFTTREGCVLESQGTDFVPVLSPSGTGWVRGEAELSAVAACRMLGIGADRIRASIA